jgi:hypothetical protein
MIKETAVIIEQKILSITLLSILTPYEDWTNLSEKKGQIHTEQVAGLPHCQSENRDTQKNILPLQRLGLWSVF